MMLQVKDLSEYCGCRDKMEVAQIIQLSDVVMAQFGYLKLTELMYFFVLFKSGRFGRFYGSVDALVIAAALREFERLRYETLDRIERERREEERCRQAEIDRAKAITWEQYLKMKNEE